MVANTANVMTLDALPTENSIYAMDMCCIKTNCENNNLYALYNKL